MSNLPANFRKIRLELAREPGHPGGDRGIGYEFVAPLDDKNRIDAAAWRANREACGVWAFHTGSEGCLGTLDQTAEGEWFFDYDPARAADNEFGYHLGRERFVLGEYVSVADANKRMHTYKVVAVDKL